MQDELTAYQAAISNLGVSVKQLNDTRAKLHAAIDAAANLVSNQVTSDIASNTHVPDSSK